MSEEYLTGSIVNYLPRPNGRDWGVFAIEATNREQFISDNDELIERMARNVALCGVELPEARLAAESQVIALRALNCRATGLPAEFRPRTATENIRAVGLQHSDLAPKKVLGVIGEDSLSKQDRKILYRAQTADAATEGRRWAHGENSLPKFFRSCIEFWTTSPQKGTPMIPPCCLLTTEAIDLVFSFSDDPAVESQSLRQRIHEAGLYRPTGFLFRLRDGRFERTRRGQNLKQ